MGRTPKPWYWRARGTWCVTVHGKRHTLAHGRAAKQQAYKAFHRLMAQSGASRRLTVSGLAVLRLTWLQANRKPRTVKDSERFLWPFAASYGGLVANEVQPRHVDTFLAAYPRWGPQTRRHAIAVLAACWRWGHRSGHLQSNGLATIERPRVPRHPRCTGEAELEVVLRFTPSEQFREFLCVLSDTGARPNELAKLTGDAMRPDLQCAHLVHHKTDKFRDRNIFFPPRAWRIVARLIKRHPTGPLFRTDNNTEWSQSARNSQVRRIRARATRAGVDLSGFTLYSLRHGWFTDGLEKGLTASQLAAVGGNSPEVISRVYDHLGERVRALHRVARKVRG